MQFIQYDLQQSNFQFLVHNILSYQIELNFKAIVHYLQKFIKYSIYISKYSKSIFRNFLKCGKIIIISTHFTHSPQIVISNSQVHSHSYNIQFHIYSMSTVTLYVKVRFCLVFTYAKTLSYSLYLHFRYHKGRFPVAIC